MALSMPEYQYLRNIGEPSTTCSIPENIAVLHRVFISATCGWRQS
jgi:hypothetical protein